jgi:hypothetical protein
MDFGGNVMNINTEINMHDQFAIRKIGMDALREKLGIVGTVRFIRQFSKGSGDYTRDRMQWLDELSDEDIIKSAKEIEEKWRAERGRE